MDSSPPGPTVHGISQARYLSGLPFPSPGDFPDPEIELESPALAGGFFTTWPTGKSWLPNAGDVSLIPGMGRSPGEGNGNPLQYSCHNNPMDRGAWQVTVHGVAESCQTGLSDRAGMHSLPAEGNKYSLHAGLQSAID